MIKKIYNISLISSILLFVFGLLMAINSEAFLKTMTIILGVILASIIMMIISFGFVGNLVG